jgi:hypothetical protein
MGRAVEAAALACAVRNSDVRISACSRIEASVWVAKGPLAWMTFVAVRSQPKGVSAWRPGVREMQTVLAGTWERRVRCSPVSCEASTMANESSRESDGANPIRVRSDAKWSHREPDISFGLVLVGVDRM